MEKFKILNYSMVTMKLIKDQKIVMIVVQGPIFSELLKILIMILYLTPIKI
jgi:hypothetical protein